MSSSIAMDVDTMMEPMVHITPLINSVNDCFTLFNKRAVTSTLPHNKSRFEQWSTTQRKESKQHHHEETLVLPIIMTSQKPQRLEKLQELLHREQEEEQETTMSNITSEDEDDSGATSPVASPIHLSPSTEHARESSSRKQKGFDETLEECEEKLSLHHVSNSIYKRDNGKLGEYFATTHPSSTRGIVKNLPSPQEDIIRSSTTEQHRCECESSSLTTGSRMSTKAVSSSSFRKYHPYRRLSTQQHHDDTSSEEENSKACCSSPCPCAPSSNPAESWIDEPSTRSSNGSGTHRHHYHHHHAHQMPTSSNSRSHCHDYHSHYNSHRHTAPQMSSSYHQCAPYHSGSKSSYPMSHDHRFDHHYPFNNRYHHHHEYDHHQAMTRPHFFNCCMPGSNIQVPSSPHHHHHSSPYCPPISTESHMMMNVSSKRRKQFPPPVNVNSQPSSRSPSPNCSTSCPSTPSSPCSVSDDDVAMEATPIVRSNNRQGSSRSKNSNSKKYNKGDWTDDEHARFLKGYEECGCQWKLIAEHYVKTRDRRQTSSHAQNFLKKLKQQQQESKTNNK